MAGIVLVVSAFVLGRLSMANGVAANGVDASASETAANAAGAEASARSAARSAPLESSYAWATSGEVLNANPAFLEARLGPAREKSAGSMMFDLGGCQVTYTIDGTAVRSFWAPVTERCRPSLAGTLAGDVHVSAATTFGQIEQMLPASSYTADCLELCGNAADPTVELRVGGAHADNFVSVAFSSVAAGEHDSLDGLLAWDEAVRARLGLRPADNLPLDRISCADSPPPRVVAILRPAHITSVTVGFNDDMRRDCR